MPEEKLKKHDSLTKRILRWIWTGLLTILLVAGLLLQAPWKVITLVLIFLLACTALPKQYRKHFWLTVLAIVIALAIWVFLPEKNKDWQPYTFDKEITAFEAKYKIPDEENAALIYNQLFETYDTITSEPNSPPDILFDELLHNNWKSKDYPKAAQWLRENQHIIDKLLKASKIERCYFSNDIHTFPFVVPDYYSTMRQFAYLLTSAANNNIAEGNINVALEKYLCTIQIGKHLCQQPTMIDMLYGIAFEQLATGQLKSFLVIQNPSKEQLDIIEDAIAGIEHNWSSDLPKFIENDRLRAKSLFSNLYEINSNGKTRLSHDPFAQMRDVSKKQLEDGEIEDDEFEDMQAFIMKPTYCQKKLLKANTILLWYSLPSTPQKLGNIIDTSYERLYEMTDPNYNWKKEPKECSMASLISTSAKLNYTYMIKLLADMSEQAYFGFHDAYIQTIAKQSGSQIIIALRRYKNKNGTWPQSLEEIKNITAAENLIDPLNGGSFVYKLTDDNFILYSKGKNNIDEAGERTITFDVNEPKWPETKEDDILIWPKKTKECNTEQENNDGG